MKVSVVLQILKTYFCANGKRLGFIQVVFPDMEIWSKTIKLMNWNRWSNMNETERAICHQILHIKVSLQVLGNTPAYVAKSSSTPFVALDEAVWNLINSHKWCHLVAKLHCR